MKFEKEILNLYPEYDRVTGPSVAKDGCARVGLRNTKDNSKTVRQLGKVMLEVKLGRRLQGNETVDHIDNNKTNDSMENLQVLTRAENSRKGSIGNKYSVGRKQSEEQKRTGDKNGMAALTNKQVTDYRTKVLLKTLTKAEVCEKTNLSERSVRNMLTGHSYTNCGGPLIPRAKTGRPSKS